MKIAICGSQSTDEFISRMKDAAGYLKNKGHIVSIPDSFLKDSLVTEKWYSENHGRKKLLEMKPIWTKNYYKIIQNSDAILIMNHEKKGINGYIGPNTLMELSVALFLEKKIFFLNSIEENNPFYEELVGIEAVSLNGDLSRI